MRNFEIVTLQDGCIGCNDNYNTLGFDPGSVITASMPLLQQFFPNIFGGNRRRLTQADWNTMFPGNVTGLSD